MQQAITPYLLYEDADAAVRFATDAFGFREVERMDGAGGGVHVELRLDGTGARLFLGAPADGFRNPREVGRTSLVYVLVEDVDAHFELARAAGAEIVEDLNTLPFGHRRYGCRDPQGHEWFFAQVLEER